jgi:hypothetical protein
MKQGSIKMNIRFLGQISILFLLFMPLEANGDPDDYLEEAKSVLPCRPNPYSNEELASIFDSVFLDEEIRDKFNNFFGIMSQKGFPKYPDPKIPVEESDFKTHVEDYRRLYCKMRDAQEFKNIKKREKKQIKALNNFLGERALPLKEEPYSYEELTSIFGRRLYEPINIKFRDYFSIMCRKDFPKPFHENEFIVEGYRCLYAKMADAHRNLNIEEEVKLQLVALYATLAFHKNQIAVFNKELADELPELACPSCKKREMRRLGIKKGY